MCGPSDDGKENRNDSYQRALSPGGRLLFNWRALRIDVCMGARGG